MNDSVTIKIKKLDERAVIPSYAHDGDVGMDLTAISVEYDEEKDMYVYHTGLSMESDKNFGSFLFLRSSNRKTDAYLCNHVGIVDSAIYRGELILCLKNRDSLNMKYLESRFNTFIDHLSENMYSKKELRDIIADANDKSIISSKMVLNDPMAFAPYKVGDRIAQMVVLSYPTVIIEEVDGELSLSDRGSNGFGSTGN